ncbi:hypothetical protein [Sphingomonas turrisvirgatae]|uniref:Uncharacterized protein n=1 Tax=Sphingomonas turrisvirgatae TaxID=1888892 RepID=A0A1E3LZS8_9SPHN|nr:hypothetical protein [Sphingomonas turrisvirgatae]ODP39239.1 hypothetical protein BFL28_10515 [Sphingomonas turrisvirgatae]
MTDDLPPIAPGVNIKHGERFLREDDLEPVLRDPLALAMLAAWMNVSVDKLPATMRAHTCVSTMTAWKRVGEAAVAFLQETQPEASRSPDPFDDCLGIHVQANAVRFATDTQPDHSSDVRDMVDAGGLVAELRREYVADGEATRRKTEPELIAERRDAAEALSQAQAREKALRAGLEDVVNPLGKLRREAEADGAQLCGLAYSIANDLNFVQQIARTPLSRMGEG